jgi:hypothetical protein
MAETLGAVRCLPSQEAGSPGQAHLQAGEGASSEDRSAAAPWTAETTRPGALEAEGGIDSGWPCHIRHSPGRRQLFPRALPHQNTSPAHEPGTATPGWV